MTPSQQAKAAGLKSLSKVSEMTGQSLQTLSNWAKSKPDLFFIVLMGCKARVKQLDGIENDRQRKPPAALQAAPERN